ncbi:MAG: hypothetical protein WDN49_03020 [Acetobacteraceae bacterium]
MMRPFTCLCMLAAAGAGLYLYQEKYRAQKLDHQITAVIAQIDKAHQQTNLLKAEWALLNEPDRLAGLAGQHLSLQPLAPSQFAQLADLGSRLPGPIAPDATPAPDAAQDPIQGGAPMPVPMSEPMAQAIRPAGSKTIDMASLATAAPIAEPAAQPATPVATARPPAPKPAAPEIAAARRPVAEPAPRAAEPVQTAAARPPAAKPATPETAAAPRPQTAAPTVQMAAAHPPARRSAPRRPAEQLATTTTTATATTTTATATATTTAEPGARAYRPLYAPVMSAFASGAQAQAIHAPTVQRTAAGLGETEAPFVGSALGMARTPLAAPVPISAADGR